MTIFAFSVVAQGEDEHRAARRLLRELLVFAGEQPNEEALREIRGEYGKPALVNHPRVAISFSHSGKLAACALSLPPKYKSSHKSNPRSSAAIIYSDDTLYVESVGCDIQLADSKFDPHKIDRISKRFPELSTQSGERTNFFANWARLESKGKCTGLGLARTNDDIRADIIYEGSVVYGGETYFFALAGANAKPL